MAEQKQARIVYPDGVTDALKVLTDYRIRSEQARILNPNAGFNYNAEVEVAALTIASCFRENTTGRGLIRQFWNEPDTDMFEMFNERAAGNPRWRLEGNTWIRTGFTEPVFEDKFVRTHRNGSIHYEFPADIKAAIDQAILFQRAAITERANNPNMREPRLALLRGLEWVDTLLDNMRNEAGERTVDPNMLIREIWFGRLHPMDIFGHYNHLFSNVSIRIRYEDKTCLAEPSLFRIIHERV